MTYSEMLQKIEDIAIALKIPAPHSGFLSDHSAVSEISHHNPQAWEDVMNIIYQAKPENIKEAAKEYYKRAMELIDEFARDRFRQTLEQRLIDLNLDQIELDLLREGA